MIAQDDPEHLAQRQLVSRRFTPRAVQPGRAVPRRAGSTSCSTPSAAGGQVEVVHGLAAQLPSRLTADLLGFPEDRWEDIKSWSERLMRTDAMLRDPEAAMGMMSAIMEFNPLLEEISAERKGCPMDDLISVWTEAGYDPMTMMHETGLFIAGGAETTRTVIARGLAVLAEHPDQWEAAAADPSLVPGLVEEVIRWVTPLNNMFRQVTRDDHIGDQPVAAGDRVMLAYPSANRDEDVFDEPFTFDIRRDPNPHLAFGQGTHFCVGANLARLELRLLFGALTQRWTQPADRHARPTSSRTSSPGRCAASTSPSSSADGLRRGARTRSATGCGPTSSPTAAGGGRTPAWSPTATRRCSSTRCSTSCSPQQMLDELRAVSPAAASIGTVVNTHANGDHCYGNQLVAGADIVASIGQRPRRWTRCRRRCSPG